MPVSTSAKKALRVSSRRRTENIVTKESYKGALKAVKKAVTAGVADVTSLVSDAQSALSRAAKSKAIHPNKAARLTSRIAKKANVIPVAVEAAPKKVAAKKSTASKKKPAAKKPTAAKKK